MKKFICFLTFHFVIFILFITKLSAQTTTLLSEDWEGGTFTTNGWTVANGSNNNWYVGTFAKQAGSYGAYIDVNATAGAANNYNQNNTFVNHFYKDITFPCGATGITISFNWKCAGEVGWDFLKVYLIPNTTTPAIGTALTTGQIGTTEYNNQGGAWQTATISGLDAYAGTTKRLVFSWINDNVGGANPAAALDNILVTYITSPTSYSLPFSEGFNATSIPTDWASAVITDSDNDAALSYVASGTNPTIAAAEGADYVMFNSYTCDNGDQVRLKSPIISTVGTGATTNVQVNYKWAEDSYNDNDNVQLQYSTDGCTWTNAGSAINRYNSGGTIAGAWTDKTLTLAAGANNQSRLHLGYLFTSGFGNNCSMDKVFVCAEPSTAPSSVTFSGVCANYMTVSWTNGNGNRVLVVARSGGAVNADPLSGTSYTANAAFGSGTQIGTGNYVVYDGTGTSLQVTALTASTTYHYAVYSYNSSGPCYNYTQATGNQATSAAYAAPAAPAASSSTICSGSTTTLTGAGLGLTEVFKWYNVATGGSALKTGTNNLDLSYTTSALSTTTTFYLAKFNGTCESARSSVVITVIASNAGADQSTCSSGNMAGNSPPLGYTGSWSVVSSPISNASGAVTFGLSSSNTSSYTLNEGDGTYVLRWTLTNGTCTTIDDVTILANAAAVWTGAAGDNNWTNPTNWSTATVPGACANITIPASLSSYPIITSTAPGASLNLTIAAGATVTINSGGQLITTGSVVVNGSLTNNGSFSMISGTTFSIGATGTYTHNPSTNAVTDVTMFTNATESFNASSTLVISKWHDYTYPLSSADNTGATDKMSGTYGNVTINTGNTNDWHQKGFFRNHSILGTLTIGDAAVYLDAGTNAGTTTIAAGSTTIGDINLNSASAELHLLAPSLSVLGNYNVSTTFNITNGITISNGILDGLSLYYTIATNTIGGTLIINATSLTMTSGTMQGTQPAIIVGGAATASTSFDMAISNAISLSGSSIFYGINSSNTPYSGNFTLTGSPSVTLSGSALFDGVYGYPLSTASSSTMTLGTVNISGTAIFNGTDAAVSGSSNITTGALTLSGTSTFTLAKGYIDAANTSVGTLTATTINLNGGVFIGHTSYATGTGTINVSNTASISTGTFYVRQDQGQSTATIDTYTQSGGLFQLYYYSSAANNSSITVNVNGIFTQTGGTFDMDDFATGGARVLNLSGSIINFTSGSITRSGSTATTPSTFGTINFSATGTQRYDRSSAHTISLVKVTVNTGSTLLANNDLQIANSQVAGTDYLTVNGTLDLANNHIQPTTGSALVRSGITINGTLQLTETDGFYNGTNTAALEGNIGSANSVDFNLASTSTIEYNGVGTGAGAENQTVTGWGIGVATLTQHKYGNLKINFSASSSSDFVHPSPTSGKVCIRTQLNLAAGEFNLDIDHNTASGGQSIVIENSSTTAIVTASGYIRSETEDNSAKIRWYIGSTTNSGSYIFPFGKSSAAGNYIPFVLSPTAAGFDTVIVSTYSTSSNNLPWPTTPISVTDLKDSYGADNSANVVDRFWQIDKTGASGTADLVFYYPKSEEPASASTGNKLKAQRWSSAWQGPTGSQTFTPATVSVAGYVTVPAINNFSPWTLVCELSPLPVELLDFNAIVEHHSVKLTWQTATEVNCDRYIIERSPDGINFSAIGKVAGQGNTSITSNYEFIDNSPLVGVSFYRLRQIDFDGKNHLYSPISVELSFIKSPLTIYPNPTNAMLTLSCPGLNSEDYKIEIVNILGIAFNINTPKGLSSSGSYNIDISELPPGSYLVKIVSIKKNSILAIERFMKI